MRIALDAMGGDDAPGINVEGAIQALSAMSQIEVALVGDREQLDRLIEKSGYSGERLSIVPSEGWVGMEEKPTEALRAKPNCSIAVCWKMMAQKEADAVISAGNTGGVVAAGLRTRLFLKGVKRPGIAVVLPTAKGQAILMDVGANPGARPEHLAQYAVMGAIYARDVVGIDSPRIGIMNIGSEDGKGNDLVREAHQMILEGPIRESYIGNVEGRGLYTGDADVIICEGFVGNVVLKVSEGMATMMLRRLSEQVMEALPEQQIHVAGAFQNAARQYEHNETGGAPLLGIDGICLIGHGSSDARSIRNSLKTAVAFKDRNVNSRITEMLNAGG